MVPLPEFSPLLLKISVALEKGGGLYSPFTGVYAFGLGEAKGLRRIRSRQPERKIPRLP